MKGTLIMGSPACSLLLLLIFPFTSLCAPAQSTQKGGTGVITGRVTVVDKPAPNITVVVAPGEFGPQRREVARATTDYEGNYRLTNLPAGRYNITPLAPTMTGTSDNMFGGTGRFVIVADGETIEKIDFALTRGGVITGRITDADGRPVIEERIQLSSVDNATRVSFGMMNPFLFQTDDRGAYRIYGIPPGRYTLSVGVATEEGMVRVGTIRRGYYQRTFYPGETDSKKAAIIEVTEGSETKDIDIKLGRQSQAFVVSGRVIDAGTGQPITNLAVGYGSYQPNEKRLGSYGFGQSRTDARGQFSLEGIVPGHYAAFVIPETESYSEPARFEITDANIDGLEIKVRRGATITGVAQIEGTSDKAVMARLQQLSIGASVQSEQLGPPNNRPATISPDGSFRLTGLPPGRASLYLFAYPLPKDLRLARVERDGVAQPGGIEITPGAEIRNVRLIFEYGNGSIRGQVRTENGELPQGVRVFININKPDAEPGARPVSYTQMDTRGRFFIEGLPAGEYLIVINAQFPASARRRPVTARQSVTVANGVETEATIVLDLTPPTSEVIER
jgi:hypothetical protein